MNRDNYIGGSISTRLYEKNLLSRNDLERLNDYDDLEDVLGALNDSSYREAIQELNRPEEYEKILENELAKSYDLIESTSGKENLLQYFREKYNFHNLKVMVREIAQDEAYGHLYSDVGNLDLAYIKRMLSDEDDKELGFLESLDIDGYNRIEKEDNPNDDYLDYAKDALDKFYETNNPKYIDMTLDKRYYEQLLKDANDIGLEDLIKYTKERIDLINVKTLMRIKAQDISIEDLKDALIDGGYIKLEKFDDLYSDSISQIPSMLADENIYDYIEKAIDPDKSMDENLLDLEKAIDDHQMDYSRKAKSLTYGPEVLINYIISKETEIKNLRIILVSKLNSLPKEFTLERLREAYA